MSARITSLAGIAQALVDHLIAIRKILVSAFGSDSKDCVERAHPVNSVEDTIAIVAVLTALIPIPHPLFADRFRHGGRPTNTPSTCRKVATSRSEPCPIYSNAKPAGVESGGFSEFASERIALPARRQQSTEI
jgi:hypothetical protein